MEYSCDTCGSTFLNERLLEAHKRIHTAAVADLYLAADLEGSPCWGKIHDTSGCNTSRCGFRVIFHSEQGAGQQP